MRTVAIDEYHVGARQERLFTRVDPDTVRGAQTRRDETDVCEVFDVRPAGYTPDDFDLLALFRRMRVHERQLAGRELANRFEQRARTGDRKPRREGRADPSVGRVVPAPVQREALIERSVGPFTKTRWRL